MSKHSDIQNLLYDYAMDSLDAETHRRVELHVASCQRCAQDLSELRQTIALLAPSQIQPTAERDDAFWSVLVNNVEREIRLRAQPQPSPLEQLYERAKQFFAFRPAYAYVISGSLATLIIAIVMLQLRPAETPKVADTGPAMNDSTLWLAQYKHNQERIGQYFRRSRTLLVGIANMDENDPTDLSDERKISRALIHEARFVRQQPINSKTEKLISDLERILIELANTEKQADAPSVELIQSGIQQQNLLFKIRMAEASFDTTRNIQREITY